MKTIEEVKIYLEREEQRAVKARKNCFDKQEDSAHWGKIFFIRQMLKDIEK
jgi:hypothetical protein